MIIPIFIPKNDDDWDNDPSDIPISVIVFAIIALIGLLVFIFCTAVLKIFCLGIFFIFLGIISVLGIIGLLVETN